MRCTGVSECDLQCEGFKTETRPIPPRFLGGHLTELRFTENRVCTLRYSDLGSMCIRFFSTGLGLTLALVEPVQSRTSFVIELSPSSARGAPT